MESLGSRLEHCLISARKIVKWTVYLSVYIGLVCVWVGKAKWLLKNTIMHLLKSEYQSNANFIQLGDDSIGLRMEVKV